MNKIKLNTPITINGKQYKELSYDGNEITVSMFAEAEARKLKATVHKAGGSPGALELDYTLHLYLGMMAVIAINPEIDITDLERAKGTDVMQFARVGRNFTTSRPGEVSEESSSDEQSETTQEPSTHQPETSKQKD
jgi:hypothetical protein